MLISQVVRLYFPATSVTTNHTTEKEHIAKTYMLLRSCCQMSRRRQVHVIPVVTSTIHGKRFHGLSINDEPRCIISRVLMRGFATSEGNSCAMAERVSKIAAKNQRFAQRACLFISLNSGTNPISKSTLSKSRNKSQFPNRTFIKH